MNLTLTCGTEAVSVCMYMSYRQYTSVITNNNSMLRKTVFMCRVFYSAVTLTCPAIKYTWKVAKRQTRRHLEREYFTNQETLLLKLHNRQGQVCTSHRLT